MADNPSLETREVVAHLAATRLFALLEPQELARLAPGFRMANYEPGQTVARQGETDATLWVVVGGQVSIDREGPGQEVEHLGFQGYGAAIGELGVFTGEPRGNTVLTIERTTLLYIDSDALWTALQDIPAAFDRLVLSEHIRERLHEDMACTRVEGEHTVAVYRRHLVVLMRHLLLPATLLAVITVLAIVAAPLATSPSAVLALALASLLLPLLGAVWAFFDYRYDCLILTNRRVVHVERTPLIDARRREAPLTRIQDVQTVTPSLWARMVGFGHITIQTAGSGRTIHFNNIASPEVVEQAVFEQVDRAQRAERRERLAWISRQLSDALGKADGEEPTAAEPPCVVADRDPIEEAWQVPSAISTSVQLLAAFLPKMRVQRRGVVTWRKHWWILIRRTWLPGLILAGALLLVALTVMGSLDLPWLWPLAAAVVPALALAWRFEDWRNDIYQLSDEHIVDIERKPLGLFEDRRQAKLEQIQDITYVVPNPIATMLNFGSVVIETAAEAGNFTFDHVYDPASVQEEIFARLEKRRAQAQRNAEVQRAEEMTRWLSEYHRLTSGDGAATALAAAQRSQ